MKRYLLPLGATLGALLLGTPDVVAQVANVTTGTPPVAPGFDLMGVIEGLGPSGLIGFLVYQLDRKDKAAQSAADAASKAALEASKAYAEGLAAKDKTIQDMTQQHADRVEKFLEDAQDMRTGADDRFHTMFDKFLNLALSQLTPGNGNGKNGGAQHG